ncbi:MAG: DUF302 domain-containing protein [Pseudomonadota bacterium]
MRRFVLATLTATLLATGASAEALIKKESANDVQTTLDRIEAAVTKNGGKVFYRIDHAAAAAEYDKEMPPAQVLIFGNPANGTGLMKKHPQVSVDLPLKVGAFEDADGKVTLIYRNPPDFMADHGVEGPGDGIAKMLDKLTTMAVSAP